MQRPTLAIAATALIAALSACAGGSSVRPSFKPFPRAIVDTLHANPGAVIQAVAAEMNSRGVLINWNSPADGYLETQSYNVLTRQSGNVSNQDPQQSVVMRFWADSVGTGLSKVVGEATYQKTADQSVMERDREQIVPPGHPGELLVRDILKAAHERFGR